MDVQCIGCRGAVPDVVGPSHEYMRASPGCWQIYNELIANTLTEPRTPLERWHHVDCFAVQHPGGAQQDRRQRQSVAVHLISLCLPLVRAAASGGGGRAREDQPACSRAGRVAGLALPAATLRPGGGDRTRRHAAAADKWAERMNDWARAAWTAWAGHHDAVRSWAAAAWEQSR